MMFGGTEFGVGRVGGTTTGGSGLALVLFLFVLAFVRLDLWWFLAML